MSFGARLKEERRRLGLKQVEFAALVGTDEPKQSLYENGRRELRAPYLTRIAAVGVDIVYVLTGRRSGGAWLDGDAGALHGDYTRLPPEVQLSFAHLAARLAEIAEGPAGDR